MNEFKITLTQEVYKELKHNNIDKQELRNYLQDCINTIHDVLKNEFNHGGELLKNINSWSFRVSFGDNGTKGGERIHFAVDNKNKPIKVLKTLFGEKINYKNIK